MSTNLDLRNRRKELGLTLLDVAKACGVSESTVSRWESGNIANMKRGYIASYARILKVAPSAIVGEREFYPVLTPDEEELLGHYRNLNEDGQDKVLDYAEDLDCSGRYGKKLSFSAPVASG